MRFVLFALVFATSSAWALPQFSDITQKAGIQFKHSYGDHKLDNIVEGTGAGSCVFDFNNDGLADIYFVTGKWTKNVNDNRGRDLKDKLHNVLYKNKGDGTFEDVTASAKVNGKSIFSTGCSAADYNNDGFVDLYVLNYGKNLLYKNKGDGTFEDVSRASNLDDARWSLSAVWFDYNQDGWLDVYIGNYLKYDDGKFRDFYAAKGYPGPLSYSGQADALFRNQGDGTFEEVTGNVGLYRPDGRAMSVSASDLNNDGFLDIYVANDAMENYYFEHNGTSAFNEKAVFKGLAFSEHGQGVSSMGPAIGDLNRDGLMDIFIPDLRYNTLLIQKKGMFEDHTRSAGLPEILGQYSGWGASLLDYDLDGWTDIFVVHGHAHFEFVQEDTLLRNTGKETFVDVSKQSGPYFAQKYVGRGSSSGDFDNDGDVDLMIVNLNDSPRLLRNDQPHKNHWLAIEAKEVFPSGKRDAIGAKVTVKTGDHIQVQELMPTSGYLSQRQARLFFGLAKHKKVDLLSITWPDQTQETQTNVPVDQLITLEHPFLKKGGKK